MEKKDYYAILGVNKDASQEDIKKAYRDKAKEHHPDTGGNDEIFKEINEANETLSNPDKRQQYDNPQPDLNQLFGGMFNDGQRPNFHSPQVQALQVNMNILINEVYSGTKKTFTFTRERIKGGKITCGTCGGSGFIAQIVNVGGMGQVQMRSDCPTCRGVGKYYSTESESLTKEIEIPAGIPMNAIMSFPNDGNEYEPNKFAEMKLVINTVPTKEYTREGQNLIKILTIPFPKLILGGDIPIKVFDKKYKITIKRGPQALQTLRLKGLGFKFRESLGDLYIEIRPDIPDTLTDKETEVLSGLLNEPHFKM